MSLPSPTRVLKADDARAIGAQAAFNFEDIQRRCDAHLDKVRVQAAQIIAEAHQEAALVRVRAEEDGHELGVQKGMVDAERRIEKQSRERADHEVQQRLRTVLPALEHAARSIAAEREQWLSEWESAAVRLSIAIASRILRDSLAANPGHSRAMIREALELAAGATRIKLRLNPIDLGLLGDEVSDVIASLCACGDPQVISDPTIEPGGSLIETIQGVIDARLETQLQRIAHELLPEAG